MACDHNPSKIVMSSFNEIYLVFLRAVELTGNIDSMNTFILLCYNFQNRDRTSLFKPERVNVVFFNLLHNVTVCCMHSPSTQDTYHPLVLM